MANQLQFLPKEVQARKDLDLRTGDTVRVHVKIQEKNKTRIQIFEGLVIARKHGKETGATFTVRKISNSVGVERIFPLYSTMIDKIEIVRRSRVRQSKIYYIREKVTRQIRRKLRNFAQFVYSTDDLKPVEEEVVEEPAVEADTTEAPAEETSAEAPVETKEETPTEEEKKEESAE